jgi:hypothetical protein
MSDTQTLTPAPENATRRSRTIAWGTTIAGATALGLAVLVGLTEIAGLSIPFSTAGPGAVIVVGLLILLVGLAVVIRSGRSSRIAFAEATDTGRPSAQIAPPPTVEHMDPALPPPARTGTSTEDGSAQSSH